MSYKAELRIELKGFTGIVPIRYERLSNASEKEKQKTFLKVGDEIAEQKFEVFNNTPFKISVDGKMVNYQQGERVTDFVDRKKVLIGAETKTIFDKALAKEYQLVEDKKGAIIEQEVETDKETTKLFEIVATRPAESYQEYVFDYEYEIFSDKKKTKTKEITYDNELLKVVEYLHKNNLLGICSFKRNGLSWAGIFRPIMVKGSNGKKGLDYFTMVMGLTLTTKQYQHLKEVSIAKAQQPISESIKQTLAILNV